MALIDRDRARRCSASQALMSSTVTAVSGPSAATLPVRSITQSGSTICAPPNASEPTLPAVKWLGKSTCVPNWPGNL